MRVPNLDRLDDMRRSTEGRAADSPAGKLEIVDLESTSEPALDAFAFEPEERRDPVPARDPEPLALRLDRRDRLHLERPERPERPERLERLERPERPERFERPERPERFERSPLTRAALGFAALAALAFVTVTLLNGISERFAPHTEAPLVTRADEVQRSVPTPIPEQFNSGTDVVSADSPSPRPGIDPPPPGAAPVVPPAAAPVVRPAVAPVVPPPPATVVPPPAATVRLPDRRAAQPAEQQRPARADAPPADVSAAITAAATQPVQRRPENPASAGVPAGTSGVRPSENRQETSGAAPFVNSLGTSASTLPPAGEPAAATPAAAAMPRAPVGTASSDAELKPTPAAVAPPPNAAASAAAARINQQRVAVEQVLERYERAFSSLDAQRAKAVWPRVNQRDLQRAFDSLEQQEFDLGTCDITVAAPRAVALCDGTARYTPRMGDRRMRTESRHWTIRLRQDQDSWTVESVESR